MIFNESVILWIMNAICISQFKFIPFIDCKRMVFHTSLEMLNMEMTKDVIGTYTNTDGGYQSCAQLCMIKVKCRSFTFFETSGDCQVNKSCPVIFMSIYFSAPEPKTQENFSSCAIRGPSSVINLPHFLLLLFNRWTEFNETWQKARSECSLSHLCFSGRSENQDGRPAPWDIFDFFSETSEQNSTKLDRKQWSQCDRVFYFVTYSVF